MSLCSRIPVVVGVFLYMCLSFWAGAASASCQFTAGSVVELHYTMPVPMSMPRDTDASLTFYTSAMNTSSADQGIVCDAYSSMGVFNSVGPQPVGTTATMPIYRGGADSGLAWSWYYNTATLGPYGYANTGADSRLTWTFTGTRHGFRLRKTGPVQTGVVIVPAGTMLGYFNFGTVTAVKVIVDNDIIIRSVQCTAFAPDVNLGTHGQSEFTGVGSVLGMSDAVIRLTNCPAGMNKIQYRLDPMTDLLDSANSVVAVTGSPAARNIGLQLMNEAGTAPLPLRTDIDFAGYNPGVDGGSYDIRFKARYRQVSSPISGGQANASLTFTMSYL